ncbi:Glutathione S-transferase S1 [Mortierella hygrophila]|uniref:Glutathione S-transferase S1 n=1 Tax=Mortierella hygrophila TaxID=979708 RepID=A0A9P6FFW0_9FUNG|nr:Glutathione S-transferase S1 [Mortierella hygrophila]
MTRAKLDFVSNSSFTSSQKTELLKVDNKDLSFTLTYWELCAGGSTSREILVYGKSHHEFTYPDNEEWHKGTVPSVFSVLPVLKIKDRRPSSPFQDKELVFAEAIIIDTFLAGRFGLLGDNEWESIAVKTFYTSIHYLRERCFSFVLVVPAELRKKARDDFLDGSLKKFCEDHEYHLKANGSNGHYVGNKLSLADIHLSNVIHFFSMASWGKMALDRFKQYESLWKVKETVEKVPEIAEWRQSALFKGLEECTVRFYTAMTDPEDQPGS